MRVNNRLVMKIHLECVIALCLGYVIFSNALIVYAGNSYPQTHQIPELWDEDNNYCFFSQETNVSCVPACVKMTLKSYMIDPLPSQSELALEMKTDINHTTQWEFAYIPFANRSFNELLNESLSDNSDLALHYLKEFTSRNYRILVITWYTKTDKELGDITHGRVITGYNETGTFFHDPLTGPNRYLHNSDFVELWNTTYGYWALVIKQDVPLKPLHRLIKFIQDNLDIVTLLLVGLAVEVHYVSRISLFTNSIALFMFFSRKEVVSGLPNFLVTLYVIIGLMAGLIGFLSYVSDESLPSEYYDITLIFYNSLTVGLIMLLAHVIL